MAQKQELQAGDCIEIFRGLYEHWALYVGDGYVVHLTALSDVSHAASSSVMSVVTNKAVVKKEGLWHVIGNNKWRVNNKMDKKNNPRPVQVILKDAISMVDVELPYSITTSNCEHFVNELRYGKNKSQQGSMVENILMAGGAIALGMLLGFFSRR